MTSATATSGKILAGTAFVFYCGMGGGILTQQMGKRLEDDVARNNLASVRETISQVQVLSAANETHPVSLSRMNAHANAVYRECAATTAANGLSPLAPFIASCLRGQTCSLQQDEKKYQMMVSDAEARGMVNFIQGSMSGTALALVATLAFAYSRRRRPVSRGAPLPRP